MNDYESLRHTKWECKYHVVFIPKCRKKVLYERIKTRLGEMFHDLARQRECRIEKGGFRPDHVHMLISIPPKYSVSHVIGFIKGKSAIGIARSFQGRKRDFRGYNFRPPDMARSNRRFPRICRILFAHVAKIILPGLFGYFGTNRVAFASIRV